MTDEPPTQKRLRQVADAPKPLRRRRGYAGQEPRSKPCSAKPRGRRRSIYVLWGIGLILLVLTGVFTWAIGSTGVGLIETVLCVAMMDLMVAGGTAALMGWMLMVMSAFEDGSLYWGVGLIVFPPLCVLLFPVARWNAARKGFLILISGALALMAAAAISEFLLGPLLQSAQ